MKTKKDRHVDCISDFCGNTRNPGAWADLWERPNGSRYITLGGGWEFYCDAPPEKIEENDPHFLPFQVACDKGEDFGYAKQNFTK